MGLNSLQAVFGLIDTLTTLRRNLGVPIRSKSIVFGDNKSVVNSAATPHARRHALSYHRVREAIAFRVIGFYYLRSEENPTWILSKHWGHQSAWPLLRCLLFWKGDTIKMED